MAPKLKCPFESCKFKSAFQAAVKAHLTKSHQPLPRFAAISSSNDFLFACTYPKCNYRGKRQLYLNAHTTYCHSPDRPFFSCPLCVRTVKTEDGYYNHVKRHTREGVHCCSICDFATPSIHTLRKHLQRHELDKKGRKLPQLPNKFKCDECDYRGPSKARVVLHKRIHSDEKPFKCTYFGCNFRCKWLGNLEQHEDRHDPALSARFGCPICPKRFCMEYQVWRHVRTHTQEKTKVCPDCDYRAATLIQVKRHQRRHHPAETPSDTTINSETNKDPNIPKKDKRRETVVGKDAIANEGQPPNLLKKSVVVKVELTRRTKAATAGKNVEGSRSVGSTRIPKFEQSAPVTKVEKEMPTETMSALRHDKLPLQKKPRGRPRKIKMDFKSNRAEPGSQLTLKGIEEEAKLDTKTSCTSTPCIDGKGTRGRDICYKCTVCGFATSSAYHLATHMKVHSDDKPFVCSFTSCGFRTKWETSLRQHIKRLHKSGPYSYKCPKSECNFVTDNTALANRHRYLHRFTLKKSFGCPYCPKKYVSKTGLEFHMRSHTGEKPFKCSLCDYSDSTRRKVEMHFTHNHVQETYKHEEDSCVEATNDTRIPVSALVFP